MTYYIPGAKDPKKKDSMPLLRVLKGVKCLPGVDPFHCTNIQAYEETSHRSGMRKLRLQLQLRRVRQQVIVAVVLCRQAPRFIVALSYFITMGSSYIRRRDSSKAILLPYVFHILILSSSAKLICPNSLATNTAISAKDFLSENFISV